jgi:hypothetical protein
MRKVTVQRLESYAAKKKRFTTKEAAKALGGSGLSIQAALANRNRNGRHSRIQSDGNGGWVFTSR